MGFIVDGKSIAVFAERDPVNIPWGANDVDFVVEMLFAVFFLLVRRRRRKKRRKKNKSTSTSKRFAGRRGGKEGGRGRIRGVR